MISTAKLRQLLLWTSVLTLMAMLVLLGMAAKHSQFGHTGSSSHYLSQAVKMTQAPADDSVAIVAPFAVFDAMTHVASGTPARGVPFAPRIAVSSFTPLLI